MNKFIPSIDSFKNYLPLFFLICLSGNPLFTSQGYSKMLLIAYSGIFSIYVLKKMGWMLPMRIVDKLILIIAFILIIVIAQKNVLGFVSYPGVLALILKILLGLFTIYFYQLKKIDILDIYIKILALLSFISIPFLILNHFGFYGYEFNQIRTVVLYTFYEKIPEGLIVRSAGMFWEPGAFAGYLLLALLFIALKNEKFTFGEYKKESFWIIMGLITTQSTTGYLIFLLILFMYALQNFNWGRIIVFPAILLISIGAYTGLPFLKEKLEDHFISSTEMSKGDISNTRFGSLNMDMEYIKAQPLIGNGLDISTRYRFHPEVIKDIGNGNGMSNFLASWGIPLFLLWLYCVYKFTQKVSQSTTTNITFLLLIILLLQGEQFLNFPMFLMFLSLPFAYNWHTVQTKKQIYQMASTPKMR